MNKTARRHGKEVLDQTISKQRRLAERDLEERRKRRRLLRLKTGIR